PWFPALMVASATIFGVLSLVLIWELVRDGVRRLQARRQLRALAGTSPEAGAASSAALLRQSGVGEGVLNRLAHASPGVETAQRLLRQARIDMAVESFVAISVACALGLAAGVMVATGSLILTTVGAGIGVLLPYMWVARRRTKRTRDFEEQFPEAIELLTRAIRAGHPISSGMRMVGEDASETVAEEFRITFEEQRFGLPFEDALVNLVHRNDLVDVRIFATALLVQRDVGGNLAEILDNLASTIRDRFYIQRQLRVYTAQGRMTGWVLGLLPIVVGSIIWIIEPEYMALLLDGLGGRAILAFAALMQIVGVLWIRRVIAIEI
ncbi:MAG: type II secretion system F family protein, partial [Gemmatimonadetes bacterium]|nr:type II secretion system F family protein [Gemmatimonadota bacterium]